MRDLFGEKVARIQKFKINVTAMSERGREEPVVCEVNDAEHDVVRERNMLLAVVPASLAAGRNAAVAATMVRRDALDHINASCMTQIRPQLSS